jgi:hypothetical protein
MKFKTERVMKKLLTLFLGLFLTGMLTTSANAQGGTVDDNFILEMTTSSGVQTWGKGDCGWNYSLFGPAVTEDLCAEVVWAYDDNGGDSLACDPISQDLTGKFAIIRRGVCNFSLKVYRAQQAGAVGVIIANHFTDGTQNGCSTIGMSAGDSAAAVVIPSIFVCRDVATAIDEAIKAGTTNICFSLPRMYEATASYHYATPASQVDSIDVITVRYVNRSAAEQTDVVVKVDILEPGSTVTTLQVPMASVAAGQDTQVFFPNYIPNKGVGKYDFVYSNNKYTESRDTVRNALVVSDYTFASDNLTIDPLGIGPSNQQFIDANFTYQTAGLFLTNNNPATATYVTFGLSNVDTVWVPEFGANVIGILIYDADANDDNVLDISNSFDDLTQIGFGAYEFDGTEGVDSLISAPITDFNGNPMVLDPNGAYYISLLYDGNLAGTGRSVRFSNTIDVNYYLNLTTPLYLDQLYSGWSGATVITRLQLEGFDPNSSVKPTILEDAKISVSPNPAVDQIRVNLDLEKEGENVAVTLINFNGVQVRSQVYKNYTNGTPITINAADMPSGSYIVWVRTAEGSTMKKVMICH